MRSEHTKLCVLVCFAVSFCNLFSWLWMSLSLCGRCFTFSLSILHMWISLMKIYIDLKSARGICGRENQQCGTQRGWCILNATANMFQLHSPAYRSFFLSKQHFLPMFVSFNNNEHDALADGNGNERARSFARSRLY